MIKPFEYFINENLVRQSEPNLSMAKSLLEKAEELINKDILPEINKTLKEQLK